MTIQKNQESMDYKKLLIPAAIIAILAIVSIGLFPDAIGGKVIQQPDMMSFRGIGSDVLKLRKEKEEVAVWTNTAFSGMPTFIWGGAPYTANKLKPINKYIFGLGLPNPSHRFFGAFLSFFIFCLVLRLNPWLGLFGALAFGLSTYNFLISEAGHGSKFMAIQYFPLIAAGTILTYRKKYILGAVIFGIGLGMDIMAGHIQMTYYMAICMAIYVLAQLIQSLRKGEFPDFAKSSAILVLPLILAIGANSSQLWTSYEYMKETIRGPQILQKTGDNSQSGLDKDYVFAWSHGVGESLSFLIPGAYGGGSAEPMDKSFETYKDLRKKTNNPQALRTAPLYWGDMPSTSGPIYFGAVLWLLFLFSAIYLRGHLKWWLVGTTLLIVMLSWGKNFAQFNDFFYNYFPMYDKFRSVNSILAVLQFTLPCLAVLGLHELTKEEVDRDRALGALYISGGILGAIIILFGFLGGFFLSFEGANDSRLSQSGYNLAAIISDRKSLLSGDAIRSFIFVALSSGLLWLYIKEKLSAKPAALILFGGFTLLTLIDLGGIGKHYLNSENFKSPRQYAQNFSPRPADEQILNDKDPHFRVLDLSINTFNSNRAGNHHYTIGGYHAAKLRRYADIIERQLSTMNRGVLSMLNTKYVITQQGQAQQLPGPLGNAWFVNNIQKVGSANQEIDALDSLNTRTTAVVHNEFDSYLSGFNGGDGQGTIVLKDHQPDVMTYESNSSSEQFAVFSEVIYKPNSSGGWQSFIDGKPADHIRANYVLRAMKIPAGKHTIEFRFKPRSYFTGELLSLVCSIVLILISIFALFDKFKSNFKK